MIKNIFLILGIILITFSYLKLMFVYLKTKNNQAKDLNGFEVAKELTANYNEINIIESKEISSSRYNLKRKVIRLTTKNYYATDFFSLAITSYLSGYSLLNMNKDKNITNFSKVFKNIDSFDKSSLLAIILSLFTNTITDAKLGVIALIIILFYQYLRIQISNSAIQISSQELNKQVKEEEYQSITKIMPSFLQISTMSFITTLILILREVAIILNL